MELDIDSKKLTNVLLNLQCLSVFGRALFKNEGVSNRKQTLAELWRFPLKQYVLGSWNGVVDWKSKVI